MTDAQKPQKPPQKPTGDPCRNCGNFTLIRAGTCLLCTTCGETTGCSAHD